MYSQMETATNKLVT